MAKYQMAVVSKKGFAFSHDDENQLLFDSEFYYDETPDQIRAIDIIKREIYI